VRMSSHPPGEDNFRKAVMKISYLRRSRLWIGLMLFGSLLVPVVGSGQSAGMAEGTQILDQVVATVDDEIVLLSDLLNDVQMFAQRSGKNPGADELIQMLTEFRENRINEKVLVAKARRDEIQIGDADVDRALDAHFARLAEQAGGESRLLFQLEREGLTERDLRKKLTPGMRDQMLMQRILDRVSYGIDVTEEEALAFYEENRNNTEIIPMRPQGVELSHILIIPQADNRRGESVELKVTAARDRLEAGEEFGAVAREISEGPAAPRGGDFGWFNLNDLAVPALFEALVTMEAGETKYDVVSEQGRHILYMEERTGNRVHFHQIFFPLAVTDEDKLVTRQRAREALKRLQAGEDWGTIVLEFSDDTATRDNGGSLPLIPEEQLEMNYRSVVEALDPGEFSSVFQGNRGYQIIRLDKRELSRPFQFDEISDQLRSELLNRKRMEMLDEYLQELQTEIMVVRKTIPTPDEIAGMGRN
jgi:parvulin-like peptidyl-prolyl isomerase